MCPDQGEPPRRRLFGWGHQVWRGMGSARHDCPRHTVHDELFAKLHTGSVVARYNKDRAFRYPSGRRRQVCYRRELSETTREGEIICGHVECSNVVTGRETPRAYP